MDTNNGFNFNILNRKKRSSSDIYNSTSDMPSPLSLFGSDKELSVDNNKIKFWTEVTDESCKDLIDKCKEVEQSLTMLMVNYGMPFEHLPHIEIYINSPGGSVHSALAVVDHIQSSHFKYVSIVEGCAASAATMISNVCDHRKITNNGMMLIHELSSGCYGKMFEMDDTVNSLRKMMDIIVKIYSENTKVNIEDLRKILKHDIFWTAEESLHFGIVDEIVPVVKEIKYSTNKTLKISDKELQRGVLKIKKNRQSRGQESNILNNLLGNCMVQNEGSKDSDEKHNRKSKK